MQTSSPSISSFSPPRLLVFILSRVVSFLIPVLLIMLSVRLVMTETYLKFEYKRPGFPADLYGWDKDIRLEYGPYGIRYLLNDEDISYLGNLEIDGEPAFIQSELNHMEDVKVVTRGMLRILNICLLLFVVSVAILAYFPATRFDLLLAISRGGFTTIIGVIVILVTMLISWDFYFDNFHVLFFKDGTWEFYTSDTLIRLYPQQFWFDSSLVVGTLTIGGALLCATVPARYLRRKRQNEYTSPSIPPPRERGN